MVLLDRSYRQVNAGNKALLTRKLLGPCKFIKVIASHVYRLEVPEATWWYNVVHATLLKPFGRQNELQLVDEGEEEIWEVLENVDSRRVKGVVQY